jgi:hypothetical protein
MMFLAVLTVKDKHWKSTDLDTMRPPFFEVPVHAGLLLKTE